MNARAVKDFVGARNAEEARALLECLCTEARNLEKLCARFKLAVLLAVLDDVLCNGSADSRNVGKKRIGCGVEVDTNRVYTVLDNAGECTVKACLLHIVLILTDTDRLGVDLYKLRKGILQTACDRNSRTLSYVEIGEFLGSEL